MAEPTPSEVEDRTQKALAAAIPNLYANGYLNHLGTGDILTVLEQNGRAVATMNLSFTTAKSLALSLLQLIGQLEQTTGRSMLTIPELEQMMMQKQTLKKPEK